MPLQLRKTRPRVDQHGSRETAEQDTGEYTSQAFGLWDEQTDTGKKRHVLELSSAHPESLRFFGEGACRLEVVGLDHLLPIEVATSEDEEDQANREVQSLRAQLPSLRERSQHGALVWDLCNYLSRPQFKALGEWLHGVLDLDALVHLVLYTGRDMPERPCAFHILDHDRLMRKPKGPGEAPCPQMSQGALKRYWPDFEVVRSFLLRNESQEFVLRRL